MNETSSWRLRPVRRPMFFLGRRLFDVEVPLYVWEASFAELPDDPDQLPLPIDGGAGDDSAAGAFVRSQPTEATLPRLARRGELIRFVPSHFERYLIKKNGSFENYMEHFSTKKRRDLNRQTRRYLEGAGPDAFTVHRTPEEMAIFLDEATAIAAQTYQARLFKSQLPNTPEFRAKVLAMAKAGNTYGTLLRHQGKPVAFFWFTLDGNTVVAEYTGYDVEAHKLSPGTTLLLLYLERVFFADPKVDLLDFGEGDAEYKKWFATDSKHCAEIYYLRPRPRTLALVGADTALWAARRAMLPIEAELERRGWRAKIRQFIRRH